MADDLAKHADKIQHIRSELSDLLSKSQPFGTDFDLLRYLQGYNFDTTVATDRLRENLRFRLFMKPPPGDPAFVPNPAIISAMGQCLPSPLVYSKQGHILFVNFFGSVDFVGALHNKDACWKDMLDYIIHLAEHLHGLIRQREAETGRQCWVYIIWDATGFNWSLDFMYNTFNKIMIPYAEFVTRHCVEQYSRIAIINTIPAVHKFWNVVRHFIPARTVEKVRILNPNDPMPELLEDVEIESIPDFIGGQLGIDQSNHDIYRVSNKIPEWYIKEDADLSGYQTHSVPAKKALIGTMDLSHLKTSAKITFSIFVNNAFHLGIYFQETDQKIDIDNDDMALPEYRSILYAEYRPEVASIAVEKPGLYKLRIFNDSVWVPFLSAMTVEIKVDCLADGVPVMTAFAVE